MVSHATIQKNNTSDPNLPIVYDHIIKAQSSLQNGDIKSAQNHLDLAKQGMERYNSGTIKPVNPDIVTTKN